jgi:hypothetical protein
MTFLLSSLKWYTMLLPPATMLQNNLSSSRSYCTTFSIWDQQLSPALILMKWPLCLLLPVDILYDHSINVTSANLVGCCSWSPIMLLNIQDGMSEICNVDQCRPMSNSTDVYTTILVNNFHSPMNVNWWNAFAGKTWTLHAIYKIKVRKSLCFTN